jgi:hypothetical protein
MEMYVPRSTLLFSFRYTLSKGGFFISNYNFMFSFTTIRYTIICLYR